MEWILVGSFLLMFLFGFVFGKREKKEREDESKKRKKDDGEDPAVRGSALLPNGGERLKTGMPSATVQKAYQEFDRFLKLRRDKVVERRGYYEPEHRPQL